MLTRKQVQEKLQEYRADVDVVQQKATLRTNITTFMTQQGASALEKNQILNDLDSYPEYQALEI